jgi:hypothetical protein
MEHVGLGFIACPIRFETDDLVVNLDTKTIEINGARAGTNAHAALDYAYERPGPRPDNSFSVDFSP